MDKKRVEELSRDIRIGLVRTIGEAGFGHIGGSASIADVLAVLYGDVMNIRPEDPQWADRDWFVLSKGHCAPALYAVLALKGFFPIEWLKTLNKPGTRLPSHADAKLVPGVDMSTGSLGQGFSAAIGIALGNRLQGRDCYTYCIVGDGETNEGEIWEGCLFAAHQKLDHLVVFVDWNKKQLDGLLNEIVDPLDLAAKFTAFGFNVQTVRGDDVVAIHGAIQRAKETPGLPHLILLDTLKGLGISFAETETFNHYMTFDLQKAEEAVAEINRRFENDSYPGGDIKW